MCLYHKRNVEGGYTVVQWAVAHLRDKVPNTALLESDRVVVVKLEIDSNVLLPVKIKSFK